MYSERTMTQEEYARLQAELESPATKMIMQSMSSIEMNMATMQELMDDIVQVNEEDHCEEGRLALRDRIFKASDSTACRTIAEVVRTKLLKG